MVDSYVIEIRPMSVGVTVQAGTIIRDGCAFRFVAASRAFDTLEGLSFKTPKEAERAALRRVAEAYDSTVALRNPER